VIYVDGQHEYGPAHRNNWRTFTYPTLGIPIPGNTYNTTKVTPEQYDQFDTEVNEIFKPYNVRNTLLSILNVTLTGQEMWIIRHKEDMWFVRTISLDQPS